MSYPVLRIRSILLLILVALPLPVAARPSPQSVPVPIYTIQGSGAASTMQGRWVDVYGVVTGVTPDGFYLQDPVGDGDPETSDGIFVYTHHRPAVQTGVCVLVERALVSEFYEKTELSRIRAAAPVDLCAATVITPVALPALRWGSDPEAHYERFEGMLVQTQNLEGVVQGPTKRYASGEVEIAFLPTLLAPYVHGGRIFHTNRPASAHLVYLSNLLGASLPDANWGDRITVGETLGGGRWSRAVLDYNFGKHQLLPLPETPVQVEHQSFQIEHGIASTDEDFTVCTLNLHGLGRGAAQFPDDARYQAQLRQHALAISERLQGCTIIGLQELGSPRDGENLAAELQTTFGLAYQAVAFSGPQTDNPEFPLTNGLLARTENITILAAMAPQGCSDRSFDVVDPAARCPAGQYPLFDRLPLVVDLRIAGAQHETLTLRVINNHWKSKAGDERINLIQRERQAHFVATLVQDAIAEDTNAYVIVLGDLNDFYASSPLQILQHAVQPPLAHTFDFLPALDRYTYIFDAASQVLDHILVTPNLLPMLARVEAIHINADFAQPAGGGDNALRTSDHDPVQIQLRPGGVAMAGGNVSFPGVELTILDGSGNAVAQTVSDAFGDFRLWELRPGQASLRLHAPEYLSYPFRDMTLSIKAGYNNLGNLAPAHQAAELGTALALVSPYLAEPTGVSPFPVLPGN